MTRVFSKLKIGNLENFTVHNFEKTPSKFKEVEGKPAEQQKLHMCIYIVYVCMCIYIYSICLFVYMYVCMYVCMYACVHLCVYVCARGRVPV